MCGFVMPRPLPPVPPTRAEMQAQREQARLRLELLQRRRPYDWHRDGGVDTTTKERR